MLLALLTGINASYQISLNTGNNGMLIGVYADTVRAMAIIDVVFYFFDLFKMMHRSIPFHS